MRVAILGAGPAGMSCANVCLSYGLTPVIIERGEVVGGAQRVNFHPNLWMLGAPNETGKEMTARLARHFGMLDIDTHFGAELTAVRLKNKQFTLAYKGAGRRHSLKADALLIATGSRARASAENEALATKSPRVVIGALADVIRAEIHDAKVLIVGGGDNALDHALYLAGQGNRVTVRTRAGFSARRPFVQACSNHPDIIMMERSPISTPHADTSGVWFEVGPVMLRYDWMLVMYGYRPNTDVLEVFAPDLRPALTTSGHIQIDPWQRTSVARVYAAGDVTDPPQPSVPTAIAQGLAAARAIEVDLLAC
jgi:thioredoxin reductase (NADPH)